MRNFAINRKIVLVKKVTKQNRSKYIEYRRVYLPPETDEEGNKIKWKS